MSDQGIKKKKKEKVKSCFGDEIEGRGENKDDMLCSFFFYLFGSCKNNSDRLCISSLKTYLIYGNNQRKQ